MHHTLAFNGSLADVTLAQVPAVTDDIVAIQNSNFIFQEDHDLLFATAFSAGLLRARIVTPKTRQISTPWIRPIRLAAVPAAEPRVADYRAYPFRLRGREETSIEAFQSSGGAQEVTALAGVLYQQIPVMAAEIWTMRGTATTAAVADAWTTLATTWQDQLPEGDYAVVGLEVQSTNARAARLILENTYPRPGSISVSGIGDRQHEMFRNGGLGTWGYFTSVRMPIVQVLCNGADAAHEIYLQFQRVR